MKDEIEKRSNKKKFLSKKIPIKRIRIKSNEKEKLKKVEIVKKKLILRIILIIINNKKMKTKLDRNFFEGGVIENKFQFYQLIKINKLQLKEHEPNLNEKQVEGLLRIFFQLQIRIVAWGTTK